MTLQVAKRVTPSVQGPCTHDSYVLTIKTDCNFHPDGWSTLPEMRTFGMRRTWAEGLALDINRDSIETGGKRWAVVVYGPNKGFHVLQIDKPKDWQPSSEYDLPPDHIGPLYNMEARQTVRDENYTRLLSGNWKTWSIHVKPIRKLSDGKIANTETDSASGKSAESAPKKGLAILPSPIPAAGLQIVQAIKDGLRFSEVTSNHLGETVVNHSLVRIDPALRDESAKDYIGKHTSQIRGLAAKLLDIANQLDGVEQTPLTPMRQIATELGVDGCDEVSILVYNSQTDQEAISKARQALAMLNR